MIVTKYYKLTDNLILQACGLIKTIVMYLIDLNTNDVVKNVFSDDFNDAMQLAIKNGFFTEMDNESYLELYEKLIPDFIEYLK